MVVCFQPSKLLWLPIMSSLFDNTAVIIYGWTPCLYLGKFRHWLNLHHQLHYCRTQHYLLLLMVIRNKGKFSELVCHKIYHHFRYTIHNSCWYSIYIMPYAFNMFTKHECTWKRMMNGSVSIAECKPSKTKGKNVSVLKQSTSLLSHLFSSLQSRRNADIYDLCYLIIKKSHHHYQTEGNGGGGQNLTS